MTQLDQDMWREFVVEAEEHLHEIEPNLLLLEQHPDDMSLVGDCFRNMHSIKGAASYMGLARVSALSHTLEDLFDRLKNGEAECDTYLINTAFEAVDKLKKLVKEIAETQTETTEIDNMLEKINAIGRVEPPSPSEDRSAQPEALELRASAGEEGGARQEDKPAETANPKILDDDELMGIYADEMKAIWARLKAVMEAGDPIDASLPLSIMEDMTRVTNYVGIDSLLGAIKSCSQEVASHGQNGTILAQDLKMLTAGLADAIEEVIGPIDVKDVQSSEPIKDGEEDRELYGIFVDFLKEEARPLATVPERPGPEWIQACQGAIEKITASANYMDYPEVVALMEEWSERLTESLTHHGSGEDFNPEKLNELWARLTKIIPELEDVSYGTDQMAQGQGVPKDIAERGALDDAIDSFFDAGASLSPEDRTGLDEMANNAARSEDVAAGPRQDIVPAGRHEAAINAPHDIDRRDTAVIMRETDAVSRPEKASQTVRIDLDRVDNLLSNVSELVILRAAFEQIAANLKGVYTDWINRRLLSVKELKGLKDLTARLGENATAFSRAVQQVQEDVMRIRMLPVGHLFDRYPRIIRDLAQKLGKKVELHISGGDTALDKRLIEQMADPLLHIIRNAVDHGIETPDERTIRLGKSPIGRIVMSANQDGNFVVMKISDDGRGLDREALLRRAVSLGFIGREAAQAMPDDRVWELIFLPGVTTAAEVTDTSGRGVGMDVVKKNVERLGGTIRVDSAPERGTEVTVRIPLTLAIIQALLVKVGGQTMAVPLSSVREIIRVTSEEISSIEGYEVMSVRQATVPVIRLSRIFRGTGADDNPQRLFVVIVHHGELEAGLGVDSLIGQQDVVIKPLADFLTDEPGFSGATILGDGSIGMILDIPAVLNKAKGFVQRKQRAMELSALGLGELSGTLH